MPRLGNSLKAKRLKSITIDSDESLLVKKIPDEKEECLVFFDSVNTKKKLQKFVDLYQKYIFIWTITGHDLSMYYAIHLNTGTRGGSINDATSASLRKWRDDNWEVLIFSFDTIKELDKRLKIKRTKKEYQEIEEFLKFKEL